MTKPVFFFMALPALAFTARAQQQIITETFDFTNLNLAIPDGTPSGLANNHSIDSSIVSIESVRLTLNVGGSFNGDLYAYITNGNGFSVLLNRPGRTTVNSFGYDDSGFSVTFDDAAQHDIHTYRDVAVPGPGNPLEGIWQPDGRLDDPDFVTELSVRSAMLSSFVGNAASGDWTLYIADLSGGDPHVLQSWSLSITGAAVPEPGGALLGMAAGAAVSLRRTRRRSGESRSSVP